MLGVTASIAIYKSCEIIRRLRESGFSVFVVQTPESEELVRPVVFQALSGNPVYSRMFESSQAWEVEHVALAEKADLVLVAPATANIIAKVASGVCDDLLGCVLCATRAPVCIAPAMNKNMYSNKIVQENIKRLKSLGYKFIGPRQGRLACGDIGIGCLAEVEEIVRGVKNILAGSS
jgi:phosphopantothenoylcysteine decarboxylase/phosphopantothenate--cysteine ligase